MLTELSEVVCDTVAEIYNKSLRTRDIPDDWRLANIQLCLNKEKNHLCQTTEYRPISLTVTLCKVLESIMSDKIIDHLERYTFIKDSQRGFVKRKSCLTNLLIFMQKVTNYLDSSYPVDVIGLYLDFQKAFDKVPHKRLLMKLQAHRIDGELLRWIKEWLSGRRQRVVIYGQYSSWIDVLSEVPQG